MVSALVSSRLDYCNTLYPGLSQNSLHHLQLQNAAARLITGSRIGVELNRSLWFQLHFTGYQISLEFNFKILLLTFRTFHGLAPSYLTEILISYVPSCNLRSLDMILLVVPKSRLVTKGYRAFVVHVPRL